VGDLTEAGEFSIDLYTMPDLLTTKLWEHLVGSARHWIYRHGQPDANRTTV
jgi:hypothetical protein